MQYRLAHRRQRGVSLVELVIAIAVVILMISVFALNYNSNRQKTTQLVSKLQEVKAGVLRFERDYPQGAQSLAALTSPAYINPADVVSSQPNAPDLWRGPYLQSNNMRPDGAIDMSDLSEGMMIRRRSQVVSVPISPGPFQISPAPPSVQKRIVYLEVENMPQEYKPYWELACAGQCSIPGNPDLIAMLVSESPVSGDSSALLPPLNRVTPAEPH